VSIGSCCCLILVPVGSLFVVRCRSGVFGNDFFPVALFGVWYCFVYVVFMCTSCVWFFWVRVVFVSVFSCVRCVLLVCWFF